MKIWQQTPTHYPAYLCHTAHQALHSHRALLARPYAHPSEEHLMPFYVALGAAGNARHIERFYQGVSDYVIAMDAYRFTPS